jgi:hypothetical protein
MKKIFALSGIALSLGACAVSKVDPLAVPLQYKMSSDSGADVAPLTCPTIGPIVVVDKRTVQLLGIRYHESKPLKADVSLANDPTPWVREGLASVLSQHGVQSAASPTLFIELETLHTSENIWHRSGYDAQIVFEASLRSPGGKTCWHESIQAKSGNYGYSGSIENYQETLNGALDAAGAHLLGSSTFASALCHCD